MWSEGYFFLVSLYFAQSIEEWLTGYEMFMKAPKVSYQ